MEAFFGHRGNGPAGSQNKVLFSSFVDAKMDAMRADLPFTKLFSTDLSRKHGQITYFLKRLQIVCQNASVSRRQMY